jgi:hypothetical protein
MRCSARVFLVLLCLGFPLLATGCVITRAPNVVGLGPLDPPPIKRTLVIIFPIFASMAHPPHTVESLRPVLRWETFPRLKDREADREEVVGQITEVTYDLRVWETSEPSVGELKLIYTRTGLTTPFYQSDVPLRPSTLYLWTIRARFLLRGQPRITEWGQELIWWRTLGQGAGGGFGRDVSHDFFGSYRFFTPSG